MVLNQQDEYGLSLFNSFNQLKHPEDLYGLSEKRIRFPEGSVLQDSEAGLLLTGSGIDLIPPTESGRKGQSTFRVTEVNQLKLQNDPNQTGE